MPFIAYFCITAAFWFSVSRYIPSHYVHPVCQLHLQDYMSKSVALISWPLKKKLANCTLQIMLDFAVTAHLPTHTYEKQIQNHTT